MSKTIVSQIVNRAEQDVNRVANEATLPESLRRIQDGFRNSAALAGDEKLAELTGLITGFRPRTTACVIAPFEVFAVMSKAEQRVVRFALCMANVKAAAYGCSALSDGAIVFDANTCRVATEEEALAFIASTVSGWEDAAVLCWVNNNLGAAYLSGFLAELERVNPAAQKSVK